MKKYRVNVNGTSYEIEIELIGDDGNKSAPAAAPAAPVAAAAPAAPASASGGEEIKSPMPGTIISVNVSAGSTVKKGDVLFILEAMKMENEIMAPRDAKVLSVSVAKGSSVESGSVLCVLG